MALGKKNATVAALAAAHKEYEFVLAGELANLRDPVGYRAADGVIALKLDARLHALADLVDDASKFLHRLGGLRVEVDVSRVVNLVDLVDVFDDQCLTASLAHQTVDLGMTALAVDDYLRPMRGILIVIGGGDALLQLEYDGAGGIDNLDIVAAGSLIGFGRFSMCPQQHLHIVQLG